MIKFKDEEHKERYNELCGKVAKPDCYRQSLFYLFSLDKDCYAHIDKLFNFDDNCIRLKGLEGGWHTGTSSRTVRLAFNLWNGYCYEGKTYKDENGEEQDLPSASYTPENIFCSCLAPYYFEAIKLRYPECTRGI